MVLEMQSEGLWYHGLFQLDSRERLVKSDSHRGLGSLQKVANSVIPKAVRVEPKLKSITQDIGDAEI